MFRNYLTYQFALSFHQLCLIYDAHDRNKNAILVSSEKMIQAFTKSLHATTREEEISLYEETLKCLEETKHMVDKNAPMSGEMLSKYEIVSSRLGMLVING